MKLCRFSVVACWRFAPSLFAQSVPEIPFDADANFLKLPANMYLGEPSGVAVNSKKHVFVFNRGNTTGPAYGAAAAQLLEFGPDGKFIREIGHNLYAWSFAHDVRIDKNDNIWVIDKGSDMIIEFNPEGRVMMVFGRKSEASDENAHPLEHPNPPLPSAPGQFRQPTDVAWDLEGNLFISDGYINSRVAEFDKNGEWVRSCGTPGAGPSQFNTPHGIANDAQGNIYVADRGNRRLQVFDHEGKFLREIKIDAVAPCGPDAVDGQPAGYERRPNNTQKPGAPWTVCISPGPTQYIVYVRRFPGPHL